MKGLIGTNYDGDITIDKAEFSREVLDFARSVGFAKEHHNGLGGHRAFIDNCFIRMYFTDCDCDLDEAETALLNKLYGLGYKITKPSDDGEIESTTEEECSGDFELKTNFIGYSEYTVTGYEVETCTLGGHNLPDILKSHIGEYVNIAVNAE